MKTSAILTILLLGSASYNVYQYSTCKDNIAPPPAVTCIQTDPFARAIEIDAATARGFYLEFTNSRISPDNTTGGVISRAAFDEMLCLEKCNGITYSFARDSSGKTGPGNNGIFIIFQGARIEYDNTGDSITTVNKINGAKMYRSGNWCPLNCMAL